MSTKFRDCDRDADVVREHNRRLARSLTPNKTANGKRVKQIHTPDMVAHLWAHQQQQSARTAHGNFYFDGPIIYSYGSHFPIAQIVPKEKGKYKCVLLTSQNYSKTTGVHIGKVSRAIPVGTAIFRVPHIKGKWEPKPDHAANFIDYQTRMNAAVDKCVASQTRGRQFLNEAISLREDSNRYAKRFGIRKRLKIHPDELLRCEESAKRSDERAAAREAKMTEKLKREREQREAENAMGREERQQAWLAGESVRLKEGDFPMQALRVRGSRIETSLGVAIEIEACKPMLASIRSTMADMPEAARHLGSLDKWGDIVFVRDVFEGVHHQVHIGCHKILVSEIERIATTLGI